MNFLRTNWKGPLTTERLTDRTATLNYNLQTANRRTARRLGKA